MAIKRNPPSSNQKEVTDYEIRLKAITIASLHQRNSQSNTLIKIADKVYKFLTGVATEKIIQDEKQL